MPGSLIIQEPEGPAERLILLFHGVGASAQNLAPLGLRLAREFPGAFVVSIDGPHASDLGTGRQWFSVRGISEESRIPRVEEAMPGFLATVRHWQDASAVAAKDTVLIGFSQGAIMALESTQQAQLSSGCVISIAGRFARPPRSAAPVTAMHLIHGESDPVIPAACTVDAARQLEALGANVTADLIPQLGHGIDDRVVDHIIKRLREKAAARN